MEMLTTVLNSVHSRTTASEATRWGQLIFGIICMVMIANLQYGWTLFVNPIDQKYHWGRAAIQVAFTIFVLTETWLVPLEGYFSSLSKMTFASSSPLSPARSRSRLLIGQACSGLAPGTRRQNPHRVLSVILERQMADDLPPL